MKTLVGAAFAVILAPFALAQEVDFGAWCSEIARYDEDRCAERRPDDAAAYDRYAQSVRLFDDEKLKKDEARRIETERVNRMGDVTADQIHDSAIGR
jgi:hypothetical protein